MKWLVGIIILIIGAFTFSLLYSSDEDLSIGLGMNITSPAFKDKESIPTKYTCDGRDISPPLVFDKVPAAARSLALIVDDPVVREGAFTHWIIWNISPMAIGIDEGAVPQGATEGQNSFPRKGYGGPCPPRGEHNYFFRLFALDSLLAVLPGASREELEAEMKGKVISTATLIGRYERSFGVGQ